MTNETSPTPQEKARAGANRTGKPWAVGEWPNGDSHHADHQWAYSCDIGKPCQRIDPEPAETGHVHSWRLKWGPAESPEWACTICDRREPAGVVAPTAGWGYEPEGAKAPGLSIVNCAFRDSEGHAVLLSSASPPAPLTLRQRFALAAPPCPEWYDKLSTRNFGGIIFATREEQQAGINRLARWARDYADEMVAVLAAERGEGKV